MGRDPDQTSEGALARLREASAAAPTCDAGVHLWIAHGLAHVFMAMGELDEARDILMPRSISRRRSTTTTTPRGCKRPRAD